MESTAMLQSICKVKCNKGYTTLRINVIIFVFSLFTFSGVYGQKLIESRRTSYNTYIYKISDKEAKHIYKYGIGKADQSYFHTKVDSFRTFYSYKGNLPNGHYLKTYSEKNIQKISITSVQDFDVFIFNNNTDLCIQVISENGQVIENADVKVRYKKLHFNNKTKAYIDKKSNQKGLICVTHKGYTAYYKLSRDLNSSYVKRGAQKVIYGTPVKYAWLPVNFIVRIPADGVKSIINGWPIGVVSSTKHFFVKSFKNIVCLIDPYYCDYYSTSKFRNIHKGYIVFNKPLYFPGDTVKFKAYLVKNEKKPVNKNVSVILTQLENSRI